MKLIYISALALLVAFGAHAQPKKAAPKKAVPKKAAAPVAKKEEARTDNFAVTETQEVQFKGTDEQLVGYFMENVNFSEEAITANAEGEVMLSFSVNFDSTVVNPIVVKKFGYGVDEQMVELVKPLKFIPAKMNGVLIKQTHMISIPLRAYKK